MREKKEEEGEKEKFIGIYDDLFVSSENKLQLIHKNN